jgi:hypothetical protein
VRSTFGSAQNGVYGKAGSKPVSFVQDRERATGCSGLGFRHWLIAWAAA